MSYRSRSWPCGLFISSLALVLVACGGGGAGNGGGGTLYVSIAYPATPINLFNAATVQPSFSGFQGHTPNCTLIWGSVPGMTVNSDCTVSGIPTAVGSFNFGVRLGAAGVSNTIDSGGTVNVTGPSLIYSGHTGYMQGLNVGDSVSDSPGTSSWQSPSGVATTWAYQLQSGSLPPGLFLDPGMGVISGAVTTQGSYQANLQATLTTPYGSYVVTGSYGANVGVPSFGYMNAGGTGFSDNTGQYLAAYVGQPFRAQPYSAVGTLSAFALTNGPLPAGLAFDPSTGEVSGTTTTDATGNTFDVTATVTNGGIGMATTGQIAIASIYPVFVSYGYIPAGQQDVSMDIVPNVTVVSPLPLSNPSYGYAVTAKSWLSCSLPAGMALNSSTGHISGTPAVKGSFNCWVDVAITNNAVTWTHTTQAYFTVN